MNTIEVMRLFSDGKMSVHDVFALLESMGHSHEDCVDAFITLTLEENNTIRVGTYQKTEMQAELFLKVEQ